ncbi:MAG: biotin--[acetyl-CoA-carboxylase] ligase [Chthonomonas sp.]|nr:biotin--[acetyl-CoA-carboxylase] ligase [Chthonomonas sp.]
MRSPLADGKLEALAQVTSTQDQLADHVRKGDGITALLAAHQSAGRGRLQRTWVSSPGESLNLSLAFPHYKNHPQPWLIGMGVAAAVAAAIHVRLQWPNDLILDGKKVGGILTEIVDGVPIVGIGVNLNQPSFTGELESKAISLAMHRKSTYDADRIASLILERIELLPEPESWDALHSVWMLFDSTPGKRYQLPKGEEAIAIGIGPEGELIASVDGETTNVLAADALFS